MVRKDGPQLSQTKIWRQCRILPTSFQRYLPWMENVHDCLFRQPGGVTISLYNAEGEMYVTARLQKVTDGNRWRRFRYFCLSSCPGPFSTMGWPGCRLRRLQTLLPNINRLRHYLLLGISRMIFQSLNSLAVSRSKMSLSTASFVTSKDARCRNLYNGIDQWMLSEKYEKLMPFVGSFQNGLWHQVAAFLRENDASWNFINKIWNISRCFMNNGRVDLGMRHENVAKVAAGQAGNVTDTVDHNLNETISKVTENFMFEFLGGFTTSSGMSLRISMLSWLRKCYTVTMRTKESLPCSSYTLIKSCLLHPIMPFVTGGNLSNLWRNDLWLRNTKVVRPRIWKPAAGVEA